MLNYRSTFLIALATSISASAAPSDFQSRPAVFEITPDVVNADLEAFTITVPAFGNTLNRTGRGGFEVPTFRNQFFAQEDAPHRIVDASDSGLHYYDSFQSGYLDGAGVQVFRIVDGSLKLVREDTVAKGGSVIEYWNQGRSNQVLAPTATEAQFAWAAWSRPKSARWFAVVAVDQSGNVSAPSEAIRITRPDNSGDAKPQNEERRFKPQRNGDQIAPPAPSGFTAEAGSDGIVRFTWSPVEADDLAGYRIIRTDTDPSKHRGVYLQLVGTPNAPEQHIRKGDKVFVSKAMDHFSRDWFAHRVANLERQLKNIQPDGIPNGFDPEAVPGKTWRLVEHGEDAPVPGGGKHYLEMTLRDGDTEKVGHSDIPDLSNTKQEFYPVPVDGAEYIMSVWMKADRPDAPPVIFTWEGDEKIGGFVGKNPIQVTEEWQRHEVRFTGRASDTGNHAYLVLRTSGPATYSFDNFQIHRADTAYLDYEAYRYEQLKRSGMMAFRTHGPIKTRMYTYSMEQFLRESGNAQGVALGNTLPQMLRVIEKTGIHPWLQIEYHMSAEEWLAFAEYMAAPYDPSVDSPAQKPYAYLRYSQGRHAPWTDAFERIYFELGNETWNGIFRPWVFHDMTDAQTGKRYRRGEVYGMFHDRTVEILRSSPYWSDAIDAKFIHILGGWANGSYSEESVRGSKHGDFVTIAAYNGGWDEEKVPAGHARELFLRAQSDQPDCHPPRAAMPRTQSTFALRGATSSSAPTKLGPAMHSMA